jgi:outer membrane protein assembly factor BamB
MAPRIGTSAGIAATGLAASLIVGVVEIAADASRVVARGQSEPVPESANRKAGKSDRVMFGGTPGRNMVNTVDKNIPDKPDPSDAKLLKWKADLGSNSYLGTPTIAGGRVFVGTNNNLPRNPRDTTKDADGAVEPIDKGILMCFDEATGKFLWQAVHDKLATGTVNDWPNIGISSTPLVEGERV